MKMFMGDAMEISHSTSSGATIDQIVTAEEVNRKQRIDEILSRRVDLAQKLADRALKGEQFGVEGFVAIGFPELTPDSEEYREIIGACTRVRQAPAGSHLHIGEIKRGKSRSSLISIKADAPKEGLTFSVIPNTDSRGYTVIAEVLCSQAIYAHHSAAGPVYGNYDEPHAVRFIDTSISRDPQRVMVERILHAPSGRAYYEGSTKTASAAHIERLRTASA